MAVKLRLKRMGAKKTPFYRIVAIDERKPRDSKYLDCVGFYDPKNDDNTKVEFDKALSQLKLGAQPSDTVRALLKKAGVMKAYHESKAKKA